MFIPGQKKNQIRDMMLDISQNRTISEVQNDFNSEYPFLKLEFYKLQKLDETLAVRKHLDKAISLKVAGVKKGGMFEVNERLTVKEFEKSLLQDYGLVVQVSRKSGMMWLETTHTDNWTLVKQNEYGREISTSVK
jgi:hypothetical protein